MDIRFYRTPLIVSAENVPCCLLLRTTITGLPINVKKISLTWQADRSPSSPGDARTGPLPPANTETCSIPPSQSQHKTNILHSHFSFLVSGLLWRSLFSWRFIPPHRLEPASRMLRPHTWRSDAFAWTAAARRDRFLPGDAAERCAADTRRSGSIGPRTTTRSDGRSRRDE